jgi:hypothetical protein
VETDLGGGSAMSALGQKQTFRCAAVMSALPPIADIAGRRLDVRFVPEADVQEFGSRQRKTRDYCPGLSLNLVGAAWPFARGMIRPLFNLSTTWATASRRRAREIQFPCSSKVCRIALILKENFWNVRDELRQVEKNSFGQTTKPKIDPSNWNKDRR